MTAPQGRRRRTLVLTCACVCALLVIAAAPSKPTPKPQGPVLTVSPTTIDLRGEPGQTLHTTVTITNGGTSKLSASFQHADFTIDQNGNGASVVDDTAPAAPVTSTRGWFSAAKPHITLKPNQQQSVVISVQIPKSAPPGTYLGAAFYRTGPAAGAHSGAQILSSVRTGPLIFVAVGGSGTGTPIVQRFDLPHHVTHGPVHPRIVLADRGTAFYSYTATLTLDGSKQTQTLTGHVIPQTPRTLDIGAVGAHLGFGRHTLKLHVDAEPGGHTVDAQRTFWVVPIWIRILVLGLLVAILVSGSIATIVAVRNRRLLREFEDIE